MTNEVAATKSLIQITYRLRRAPAVENPYGEAILPFKAVVEQRGERRKIVIHGQKRGSWRGRSMNFNLEGYTTYPPPPGWLLKVIEECER